MSVNLVVTLLLPFRCAPVIQGGNTLNVASVEFRKVRKLVGKHLPLPRHYFIDESDPDFVVLRRQDGSSVAVFSAMGATRDGIVEAAREDYRRQPNQGPLPEGSDAD
jgi:hypothetical protein